MAQNVIINGVTYQNVPEVDIPKNGGGSDANRIVKLTLTYLALVEFLLNDVRKSFAVHSYSFRVH